MRREERGGSVGRRAGRVEDYNNQAGSVDRLRRGKKLNDGTVRNTNTSVSFWLKLPLPYLLLLTFCLQANCIFSS